MFSSLFRTSIRILLCWSLLSLPSHAYILSFPELMHFVIQHNQSWTRVVIHTEVEWVQKEDAQSFEKLLSLFSSTDGSQKAKYRQVTYWHANGTLISKLMDYEGKTLYFHYNYNNDTISRPYAQDQPFYLQDAIPAYVLLMAPRPKDLEKQFHYLGITPEVALHKDEEYQISYYVGQRHSPYYALVNRDTFELESLYIMNPRQELPVEVAFGEMKTYKNQKYPEKIEYWVEGQLWKTEKVTKIEFPKRLPIVELREEARSWAVPRVADLSVDYTN